MGQVHTNDVALSYSLEPSLGIAGTLWYDLEYNSISTFGAEITTVSRQPISTNRQRRKSVVTDLDSTFEYETDLTGSAFRDFIAGFCFVKGVNSNVTQMPGYAAVVSNNSYVLDSMSSDMVDKLKTNTLLWVTGAVNETNNGLKMIAADTVINVNDVVVEEILTEEAGFFRLSMAGYRTKSITDLTWTWDETLKRAVLGGTGLGTILESLGLMKGMEIHIGSVSDVGDYVIGNALKNVEADDMYGYARCMSISDDAIAFDKVDVALRFADNTSPIIDIVFGEFFRNVPTNDVDYVSQSFQVEMEMPGLGDGDITQYQYSRGNFCNSTSFNLPITDKAIIEYGFIGTDTANPVDAADRKPGTWRAPKLLQAFSTSTDIVNLRINNVDDTGLTTDFKNVTLTLGNNVSPEKVLGTLGARFINTGNFEVDIEAQLVFSNSLVVAKIRSNETVTMDFKLKNEEGVIICDIPSMTLEGGGRDYPVNETVLLNCEAKAFEDTKLGTSLGISIIPVPIP